MTRIESLQKWRQHFRDSQANNKRNMRHYNHSYHEPLLNYYEGKVAATNNFLQVVDFLIEMEEIRDGDS
jgi:predicted transcriptional regulator